MRSILIVVVFNLVGLQAFTQNFDYTLASTWQANPEKHSINPAFAGAAAVGILDERNVEYRVENKEITYYNTYHRIVHINTDKGIEMYNKIYLPMSASAVISDIKGTHHFKKWKDN